ncbi:hypothetical protein QM480_16475 [Flectobacillus sp. DC10W]|jgi:hypothetical protein|uniref:TonB C-terminal domain-containing protein n=1 Tax=Flectobacillus longus TaxID=2984207 RepID=A0ABT6YQV0_9BACT|nr:hypothetical protein [Flectobacillus longus]MDI9865941.1 hypothetical protein [Flectobacillus longus]
MKRKYLLVLSILSIYTANTFAQSSKKNSSKFAFKLPDHQAFVLPANPYTSVNDVSVLLSVSSLLSSFALVESVSSETPDLRLSSSNRDYVIGTVSYDDENDEDDEAALRSIMDKKAKVKETIVLQKTSPKVEEPKSVAVSGASSTKAEGGLYEYVVKEAMPEVTLTEEEKKQYNSRGMRVLSLLEEEAYSDSVFTKPDQIAVFPGGSKSFLKYLDKTLKTSKKLSDAEKQDKVIVQFVVRKDGRTERFKLMKASDVNTTGLVLEALNKMPNWEPAITKGATVSSLVQVEVPVISAK